MNLKKNCWWMWGLAGVVFSAHAADLEFAGFTWTVRSGRGGPGPNVWEVGNVWLDSGTNLHLKISQRAGQWSCAEVTLRDRLGFGRYEFQIKGRLDRLDDNVVLGLFNYPTRDVGPDGTHEIDIEFARWGDAKNPLGNYTVWPVEKSLKQVSKAFPVTSAVAETTHLFTWRRDEVQFRSMHGHQEADGVELGHWVYSPKEAAGAISQRPMPIHFNLWLFKGQAPKNGQEVEVIISRFKFTPE